MFLEINIHPPKDMEHKKKIQLLFSFTLIIIFSLSVSCGTTNAPKAPTNTTGLTVSVITSTTGGGYAPRNVVAIWVENSTGTFVKSLTVYAQARKADLTHWEGSSAGSTVDAVTGATQSGFGVVYGSWNGTDKNNITSPDGEYRLCMEITDKNSTGNFSYFAFTKGPVAQTLKPANTPSFSTISIKWVPL